MDKYHTFPNCRIHPVKCDTVAICHDKLFDGVNAMKNIHHQRHFYGSTTLGEKGQVVIPAEARDELSLEKGEKLLVFGLGKQVVAFTKLNQVERILGHLENKLNNLKKALRETKNK